MIKYISLKAKWFAHKRWLKRPQVNTIMVYKGWSMNFRNWMVK